MPLQTTENNRDVLSFINQIKVTSKKEDSLHLIQLIQDITGYLPKMWGNEKVPDFIIGFGRYTYIPKGKKEILSWFHIGFAPRASKITLYFSTDLSLHIELLEKLGKCSWGKGCLYINHLKDIDLTVLQQLINSCKTAQWHNSEKNKN